VNTLSSNLAKVKQNPPLIRAKITQGFIHHEAEKLWVVATEIRSFLEARVKRNGGRR